MYGWIFIYTNLTKKTFDYTWIKFPGTLINIEFNMEKIDTQEREWLKIMEYINSEVDDFNYYDELFD